MWLGRFKIFGYIFVLCIAILFLTISINKYGNQKNRPNIIILLLDCVRADHLSCYGYYRDTSPHIDALASQGTKFNKTISQAPWTLPAVASFLSGYYPRRHGAGINGLKERCVDPKFQNLHPPDASIPLLPELLQQNDYQTWGFSTNLFINWIEKRGFHEFKYQYKAPANKIVDYGIEKLLYANESKKPFFLYLHFMDAHRPLQPPGKYFNYFPTSDGRKNKNIHEGWMFVRHEDQHGLRFKNYKEHKISLYDGSIRYMDAEIGRLIKTLKRLQLINNTVIVVVADHGEEFWEHAAFEAAHYQDPRNTNGIGHGHTMFQELLWVPLIVTNLDSTGKLSSFFKVRQKEIEDVVQLIDVFPTLLEKIGLQTPLDCDGRSLLSLVNRWRLPYFLNSPNFSSRSIFSESPGFGNLKISLLEFPYKCIYSYKEKNALFNLEEDPQERKNLFEGRPEIASDMLKKIHLIGNGSHEQVDKLSLSKEDLEALKSLGYIK